MTKKTEQKKAPSEAGQKRDFRGWFLKWCDEWCLAGRGIYKAGREWRFWVAFLVAFLVFGTLMNLLANGLGVFGVLWRMDWGGKWQVLSGALLGLFGVGQGSFWDWFLVFFISLLQGVLIGLVVLVAAKKREAKRAAKGRAAVAKVGDKSGNAQGAGIAAGLAVLGAGCPTCGTTLLAPVIGAISSTGSFALAGAVSGVLIGAAVIIALLTIKKTGVEVYVIIVSEEYMKRKGGKK